MITFKIKVKDDGQSLSPQLYSGLGADTVMESIT